MGWQLQDAKARLSELVKLAQSEGPQAITVHGKPAVVVVSREEYERLAGRKQKFTEFIRRSPLAGVELELKRDRSAPRKVRL
jgi:prevent-host-death family protein